MINNVVLVGRLTKDPDLRYTNTGLAVATFAMSVNLKINYLETIYQEDLFWEK